MNASSALTGAKGRAGARLGLESKRAGTILLFLLGIDARPRQLIGKTAVDTPSKPADAVKILKANPLLHAVSESDSKIGGLSGKVVVLENTSGQHAGVMVLGPGDLGIDSGRKLWVACFATPDGLVAVMIGGSIAKWRDALDASEPVLESIRF